jgi:hypothetical protein
MDQINTRILLDEPNLQNHCFWLRNVNFQKTKIFLTVEWGETVPGLLIPCNVLVLWKAVVRETSAFCKFTSQSKFIFRLHTVVGSPASEFLGWTWNTHVGIPMLDIEIPYLIVSPLENKTTYSVREASTLERIL